MRVTGMLPGLGMVAAMVLAQPAMGQDPGADRPALSCGTAEECLDEGVAATDPALSYRAFLQACAWASGEACRMAQGLVAGSAPADAARLARVGCQLDDALSCREAARAAVAAGNQAEAWAWTALAARLSGQNPWLQDGALDLSERLPDGRQVLPAVRDLPGEPEGVADAVICAGFHAAVAPDSAEAAGWRAAAQALFATWTPQPGQPPLGAAEADRWIADQTVTWADAVEDEHTRRTRARCYLGLGPLSRE